MFYDPSAEAFNNVVRIEDLGIGDLRRFLFDHDVVELCTAVKGQMMCRLLDEGASKVIYLDPDIAVFDSLSEIETLLEKYDIILTPHQLEPDETRSAIVDNEIGSLKYGIYNLGFVAVAATSESRRFAKWWRDRLLEFCFDDVPNGLFTDQRWCDHVPSFFAGAHILRDPGYNVASWNLSKRLISIEADGSIRAAGHRLRFFHFTKVTWVGETMLERYADGRIEVFELMHWYRARLAANSIKGIPSLWWAYGQFDDGTTITREYRLTYRNNSWLREHFPDPFSIGSKMFEQLQMKIIP